MLSSKIIISFIFIFALAGCGVKSKPFVPPEKAISSYIESYTGTTDKENKQDPNALQPNQEKKK